jgi:hypothetical protein
MIKEVKTYTAKIYISASIDAVAQLLREYAFNNGACFTIEKTLFIYTGGEECGVVVGLVNYPKFEKDNKRIFKDAVEVAELILSKTFQRTCLIVAPDKTRWIEVKQ